MKPDCWVSFTFYLVLLFQISVSRGSTLSPRDEDFLIYPQDGDCLNNQCCGDTLPTQTGCEQNFSPSMTSTDLIQSRKGDCPESLIRISEIPKVMETSKTEDLQKKKTGNVDNIKRNLTSNVENSRRNIVWNVIAQQALFLSKSKKEITHITQGIDNSLTGLGKKMMMYSKYKPAWNVLVPKFIHFSRSKREAAQNSPRKINALFALRKSKDNFNLDQSLEKLLRRIIGDHLKGCDLIVIYDEIYKKTRTLETLVTFPYIKQVLHLVSTEDLSDKIQWESQNCQWTIILMSDPEFLIKFGGINRFHWAYKAKVIIVGLQLHSLERFLKTIKGRKTEHVIGVVEDPINHNFEVYMNLLFWGEGMQRLTGWSGNNFTRITDLFPEKVEDLRKAELTVMIFEYRPLSFYEYAPDRTVITRHGRYIPIVRTLAEKFNFTINFIDIENGWGLPLGNGSFNGLVGYLQRDDGHIGLPFLYMSAQENRHKEQDHSHFVEDEKLCFLVRREAPRPAWQSLGLPFTRETWIAVISGIILSGPIFYLFVMASTVTGEECKAFQSLAYSSLFTIGIQIDSPLGSMPKRTCNRIFIVILLIYSLVLSTGYTSNLISFLTVARPPRQINTFKDLAESELIVHSLEWMKSSLELSGDPHLKIVADRFEAIFTMDEVLDAFMEGKASIINSEIIMNVRRTLMRTKTGKPLTRFLKECLSSYTAALGYQWHAPVNPRFDEVIARLVESGITKHWFLELNEQYKKFVEREGGVTYFPDIWPDDEDGLIPLSNNHLTGLWAVLIIGIFLATVSFGAEVIFHKGTPFSRAFD